MLSPKLITFAKTKSTYLVKTPADMLQFGCLQYAINNEYFDEYSKFGWIPYISEEEKNSTTDTSFSYYINDIGFRGTYPSVDDKKLMAFFGCSITFGQGLPEDKIYADLIARHYNKQYLNLGIPGAGCHRIALTFSAAVRVWDIETAVIMLPPFRRFHYCDDANHLQSILLTSTEEQDDLETIRKDIVKHFSDQFLASQAIDAIQWIIDIAKSKQIKLVLATWDLETRQLVNLAFDLDTLVFNIIDRARDGHPGIESHQAFADTVIKSLTSGTYIC